MILRLQDGELVLRIEPLVLGGSMEGRVGLGTPADARNRLISR